MEPASLGLPFNWLELNQQEPMLLRPWRSNWQNVVFMEKFPLQVRKTFWLRPAHTILRGLLLLFSELLTGWMNGRYKQCFYCDTQMLIVSTISWSKWRAFISKKLILDVIKELRLLHFKDPYISTFLFWFFFFF